MKSIKISPLSVIWMIALVYFKTPFLSEMLTAIALHEAGHLIFARMLHIKIKRLTLLVTGASIEAERQLSYTDELLFALGGPLFGIFGFFLTIHPALCIDEPFFYEHLLPFSIISLLLGLFNLIPLPSLDGGRIVKCLLLTALPLSVAESALRIIGFLTLFTFWLLSVYFLLKFELGLQMFVFCLIFFAKCFIFNKENRDFASF